MHEVRQLEGEREKATVVRYFTRGGQKIFYAMHASPSILAIRRDLFIAHRFRTTFREVVR